MMTTDQRAELDAAMAKATKGPWGVWVEPCAHPSSAQQELVQQVEQTEGFVGALYMIEADGKCPATTGCGPTSAANAAAIVALHNAYPLLTATIDAQAAEIERLREAYSEAVSVLGLHTQYGCPVCPGDCSSANPPMMNCPTDAAKRVFGRFDAALASNGAA